MPNTKYGWVEVIAGCMASGKTWEVIRRIDRATIAGQQVLVFRPDIDTRGEEGYIQTLDGVDLIGVKRSATTVRKPEEILGFVNNDTQVVVIDEAQFFPASLVVVCHQLAMSGKRVIVAGLDTDFRGEPYGPIPYLLAIAERIDKLTAICVSCRGTATMTQRLVDGEPAHYNDRRTIVGWVGQPVDHDEGEVTYEPRCPSCHEVVGIEDLWGQLLNPI